MKTIFTLKGPILLAVGLIAATHIMSHWHNPKPKKVAQVTTKQGPTKFTF